MLDYHFTFTFKEQTRINIPAEQLATLTPAIDLSVLHCT
jgi:hypothetical protein